MKFDVSPSEFLRYILNPSDESISERTKMLGKYFSFEDGVFSEPLHVFKNSYEYPIAFSSTSFESLIIDGGDFKEIVSFQKCIFKEKFTIYNGNFTGIYFDNCTFENGFEIFNVDCNAIHIENCKSSGLYEINGGIFAIMLFVSESELSQLSIAGHFLEINHLRIESKNGTSVLAKNAIINSIFITGNFNTNSRLNFKKIKNSAIELDNVNNDGKFYFTDFQSFSEIHLKDFDITNTDIDWFECTDNKLRNELARFIRLAHFSTFLQIANSKILSEELEEELKHTVFPRLLTVAAKQNSNFKISFSSAGYLECNSIYFPDYKLTVESSDLSNVKLINSQFPRTLMNKHDKFNNYNLYNDLYTSANRQNNILDKIIYYKSSQRYLFSHFVRDGIIKNLPSIFSNGISNFYSSH